MAETTLIETNALSLSHATNNSSWSCKVLPKLNGSIVQQWSRFH